MEQEIELEFNVDFRLTGVSLELITLDTHLKLIEEQIEQSRKAAKCELESELRKISPDEFVGDDWETWDLLHQDYYYHVGVVLPRTLRSPFLVTLFTVYEAAVTEIARFIQKRQSQKLSLNDIREDNLLDRAKKYYEYVLQFELSTSNRSWERLTVLSDLRNAMAHANGRLDMVRSGVRSRILRREGVDDKFGYMIVNGTFLRETFDLVKRDLEDLVDRCKKWDTDRMESQQGQKAEQQATDPS